MIIIFKKEKEEKPKAQENENPDIPSSIDECESLIKSIFHNSIDVLVQKISTHKDDALIVYIDGLADKDLVDRDLIRSLKSSDFNGEVTKVINAGYYKVDNMPSFIGEILQGNVAIFYENSPEIVIVDFKHWAGRSVDIPESEAVTRGPKEGFTESIRINTSLLRRKIRTPKLVIDNSVLGRQTNTQISLVYIDGIVNMDVLTELKSRLSKIDTDSILDSGYIEQFIEENTFSTVSGIGLTQKPDIAAARILEGRVAILVDGTPHVLTVPELFVENIQASEDYYNRVLYSNILRILRIIGLFITVILPGLAVAIFTYNQEMMPNVFLVSIITSTTKTPMPQAAEILLLIIMFELLKEAGTRLPKTVGSAITIVGSLIIGDSAVKAGIVGAPAVIIVALTAVTSFLVPNLFEFTIIYRLFFLFLGSTMGLIGISTGFVVMLIQLISTNSFGIPILSSFSKNEMKDSFIRFPIWSFIFRPLTIAKNNIRRRGK